MALIECHLTSVSLKVQTSVHVIIPTVTYSEVAAGQKDMYDPGTKFQTLYLLHGYAQNQSSWIRNSNIERYAVDNRLAVVMPAAEHSFYADMAHGNNYWTYISEELPRMAQSLFPLSDKREDNFAAGLSMGGYGAFKLALRKPERFSAAASLSGVLDIARLAEADAAVNGVQNSELADALGNLSEVRGSENDLFQLASSLKNANADIPRLYQCCGTEDFLYQDNLRFRDHALQLGVDLTYNEGPGMHDWNYWEESIQQVLRWLPLKKRPV